MADEPKLPPLPKSWKRVPRGRVLVFAPHPDDEVAGPGGVLAMHRAQGDAVRVVVSTDGVTGDPEHRFDRASYAALRRAESRAGLQILGVDDVQFWGFPDSCVLSAADLELGVLSALDALAAFAPDVVYLPWALEGHPDHHALDVIVDTTAVFLQKQRAMLAHASQLAYVQYDHCLGGLSAYRALVHQRGKGYGEAFALVRGELPAALAEPT